MVPTAAVALAIATMTSTAATVDTLPPVAHPPPSLRFSWDTLPVFFHSANSTGPWSDAAITQIARYPMATFEKSHAFGTAAAGVYEETLNPHACQRVAAASNGTTSTVYYLNSAIDWPFYELHQEMLAHPEYRLKDAAGDDVLVVGQLAFDPSVDAIHDKWLADCSAAVDAGCSGCFIDRSNNLTQLNGSASLSPQQQVQYGKCTCTCTCVGCQ